MGLNFPQKNFTFTWKGAVALIAGLIVGTSIVALANVFSIFIFTIYLLAYIYSVSATMGKLE